MKLGLSTYIGETQAAGVRSPVFFDPHYPLINDKPPVTTITGSPGSGKTFLGEILACHASILGKVNLVFDPKGDFVALKRMANQGILNDVRIWNLLSISDEVDEEGNPKWTVNDENIGMLDPTSFTSSHGENTALTLDIIKVLVGEISNKQKNNLQPIVKDVVESNAPSLLTIVRKMKSNRDDDVRSLGFDLETALDIPLAKLLATNKRIPKRKLEFSKGTTIANLMGLVLPKESTKPVDYNVSERVSVSIMNLLTKLALDIMTSLPKRVFKTLIVDEAWVIAATPAGRGLLKTMALLGRSKNMASILLTQSPQHLDFDNGESVESTISTRFAFRNNDKKDNELTCQRMGLNAQENFEDIILMLETGMCLMQDCNGGSGVVQIITQDNWADYFNTNPMSLLK